MAQTNGSATRTTPSTKELTQRLQTLQEIMGTLTGRSALSSRLGTSHQGLRDIYKTLGYQDNISSNDMLKQWARQDIARAIVDRPVKATWQGDVYINEPSDEEETALEKEYKALEARLKLKSKFIRLDRLGQLGKYAVMLLGFDDSSPETWSQPVTAGKRKLNYVKVLSEQNAEISTWETDASNERYGLPRLYKIKLTKPGNTDSSTSLNVHHSRVVHLATDLLENDIEGEPVMKTAFNRLKDLEKLVGGSAEMFWRGARPGYAGEAEEGYKIGADVKQDLMKQIEEYEHDLRRFIVAEGVDLKNLEQQVADPKGHVEVQLMMISAVTQIPMRILLGSERGQLASEQDEDNWKEYIESRRAEEAEPYILRPFVDRLIKYQVLPVPLKGASDYQVVWSSLFVASEREKADVASKRAKALTEYAKEPAAEYHVPLQAFLQYFMQMEQQDIEQIIKVREAERDGMISEEDELEDELVEQEIDTDPETDE